MPILSLPAVIEPFKWADRATEIVADVPLAQFGRLSDGLLDREGTVSVRCRLDRDRQHVAWLTGEVSTTVHMTCQRCLEAVAVPLSSSFELALLHDEEHAERLSEDADYLVVEDHGVALADILEDELLLGLPYIPMHEDCEATPFRQVDAAPAAASRDNPFQVLAALKKPPVDE